MNQEGPRPRLCEKSSFGAVGRKNFFHNCLITNDLEGVKG